MVSEIEERLAALEAKMEYYERAFKRLDRIADDLAEIGKDLGALQATLKITWGISSALLLLLLTAIVGAYFK